VVDVPLSAKVPRVPTHALRDVQSGSALRVTAGEIINGKYLIESLLGEGGVGIVAAARNIELDERVALKFLRPEMIGQTEIVARFMREAKAACSIKSEYVATVFDVGSLPDGSPFLVMEYLEGSNLGEVVEARGTLGCREAAEYIMQACEGLAVAHAKGVVHRDIKPENLFLTSRAGMSIIKVLDFGISKAVLTGSIFGGALPQVRTINLMGTPLYMSPEQIRSAAGGDMRSDIWALGMVLYELLTGTLPLSAPTITELCAAVLEAPLVSITSYRDDLPEEYVRALERCIERDPAKRFQNVAEMAVAFMPFAPKRARICAERATLALRAVGMIDEGSFGLLSSFPPPSHPASAPGSKQPSFPGTAPVARFSAEPPTQPSRRSLPGLRVSIDPTRSSTAAPLDGSNATEALSRPPEIAPPAKGKARLVVAFLAVGLAAVGGTALAMQMRTNHISAIAVDTTPDRTHPGSASANAGTPIPTTSSAEAPSVTATATASVGGSTTAKKTGSAPWWAAGKPSGKAAPLAPPIVSAPTAAVAATAATPKKKLDEPDLGY